MRNKITCFSIGPEVGLHWRDLCWRFMRKWPLRWIFVRKSSESASWRKSMLTRLLMLHSCFRKEIQKAKRPAGQATIHLIRVRLSKFLPQQIWYKTVRRKFCKFSNPDKEHLKVCHPGQLAVRHLEYIPYSFNFEKSNLWGKHVRPILCQHI